MACKDIPHTTQYEGRTIGGSSFWWKYWVLVLVLVKKVSSEGQIGKSTRYLVLTE